MSTLLPASAVVQPSIAALFVERGGVYFGVEGVDPWDAERDARRYEGPCAVVAHPPCGRWSVMGNCRRMRDGNDGGCFDAALGSVRRWGGVLEHPAWSLAWERFGLPMPTRCGWSRSLFDDGWTTEVDQGVYGTPFRKRTWLYYVGRAAPPALDWRASSGLPSLADHPKRGVGCGAFTSRTPDRFRDELIRIARAA